MTHTRKATDPILRERMRVMDEARKLNREINPPRDPNVLSQSSSAFLERNLVEEGKVNDKAIADSIASDLLEMEKEQDKPAHHLKESRLSVTTKIYSGNSAQTNVESDLLLSFPSDLLGNTKDNPFYDHLTLSEKVQLARHSQFSKLPGYQVPAMVTSHNSKLKLQARQLLRYMVYYETNKAKELIEGNPKLLFENSVVMNASGRFIKGMAYQIALDSEGNNFVDILRDHFFEFCDLFPGLRQEAVDKLIRHTWFFYNLFSNVDKIIQFCSRMPEFQEKIMKALQKYVINFPLSEIEKFIHFFSKESETIDKFFTRYFYSDFKGVEANEKFFSFCQMYPHYKKRAIETILQDQDLFLQLFKYRGFEKLCEQFPEYEKRAFHILLDGACKNSNEFKDFCGFYPKLKDLAFENLENNPSLLIKLMRGDEHDYGRSFSRFKECFQDKVDKLTSIAIQQPNFFNNVIHNLGHLISFCDEFPRLKNDAISFVLRDENYFTNILHYSGELLNFCKKFPEYKESAMDAFFASNKIFLRIICHVNYMKEFCKIFPECQSKVLNKLLSDPILFVSIIHHTAGLKEFIEAYPNYKTQAIEMLFSSSETFFKIVPHTGWLKDFCDISPDLKDRALKMLLEKRETFKKIVRYDQDLIEFCNIFPEHASKAKSWARRPFFEEIGLSDTLKLWKAKISLFSKTPTETNSNPNQHHHRLETRFFL